MKARYEYFLNHKDTKMFLRYIKENNQKHYVRDIEDASVFTIKQAKAWIKKFKHPENWVIIRRKRDK